MATIDPLPPALAQTLERCPMKGERNVWLMQVASRAQHVASASRVRRFLHQIAAEQGWKDRDFSGEIERAISRVYGYRQTEGTSAPNLQCPRQLLREKRQPWPTFDPDAWAVYSQHDILFELTSKKLHPAHVLDALYDPEDLLCLARDIRSASTMPRHNWRGKEPAMQYMVANPMTATIGRTIDGKLSQRCLEIATQSRIYQVIEFDRGTPYEQASILSSLHTPERTPMVLVVWSGGKSMHGWFDVRRLSEEQKRDFFGWAVTLGADPSLWDPCKLVRMPGGRRIISDPSSEGGEQTKPQPVLDFRPNLILK